MTNMRGAAPQKPDKIFDSVSLLAYQTDKQWHKFKFILVATCMKLVKYSLPIIATCRNQVVGFYLLYARPRSKSDSYVDISFLNTVKYWCFLTVATNCFNRWIAPNHYDYFDLLLL
jgi:hypothetical protein